MNNVLEQLDMEWLPVIKVWELNERHVRGTARPE
ncbi:hypothetical protein [Megamonas hypermegale]